MMTAGVECHSGEVLGKILVEVTKMLAWSFPLDPETFQMMGPNVKLKMTGD